MKRPVFWVLSTLLMISFCQPVWASRSSVQQLEQNKAKLEQNKKSAKNALDATKAKEKSVTDEISQLDQTVTKAQDELDAVDKQLADTTARLQDSEKQLSEAVVRKDKQLDAFGQRLKFIHESGDIGYLQAVLQAKTFGDMLIRMQYVNDIMEYDKTTLDNLKKDQETIAVKTEEIKGERDKKAVLLQEQKAKMSELTEKRDLKQKVAEGYRLDAAKYEQELASWEAASTEVERMIAEAEREKAAAAAAARKKAEAAQNAAQQKNNKQQSGNKQQNNAPVAVAEDTPYTGGQFAWPVPGRSRISSGYGYRSRPIGSGREFHTGIDIPGPLGTNIVAAAEGTVIKAGYVNGFGNTVMIDHGGGLVTLYGHNSKLSVSKGQTVKKGEVIAKCGSTGNSTGNHCHFEVRKNGKHTSPMPYLG